MVKTNLKIVSIVLIILCLVTLHFSYFNSEADGTSSRAEINYDKFILDPINDVKKFASTDILTSTEGFEDIDVVRAISYQPLNELGLISQLEVRFELTVYGIITDDSDILYTILVSADGSDYIITYNDGSAEGISSDNPFGPSFDVESEGAGTDTLNLTLNLLSIGNPRNEFDWTVLDMMLGSETTSDQFIDKAPDKLLRVTSPTHLSTVHSEIQVGGIVEESIVTMQNVEYQINSKSSGGWVPVDEHETDFSTWSFQLDTTTLTDDAVHDINVRGFDGERYFEDTLTLYVVQSNKISPETLNDPPEIIIGDKFDYSSSHDPTYMGIQLEMITDLTEIVVALEEVTVDGTKYEVWKKELYGDGVVTYSEIPINFVMDGYSLITKDEFSLLEIQEDININVILIGEVDTSTLVKYSPPLDTMDFPLVIGEKWASTNSINSTTEIRFSGDYSNETSQDEIDYEFEALHTEVTEVPAGEFDTFVIRSQQKGSDMYDLDYYSPLLGNVVRSESYDNNNELIQQIDLMDYEKGIGGYLDIIDAHFEPPNPKAKETVEIIVDVKNTGTVNLTEAPLSLYVNGDKHKEILVDVPAQKTVEVVFTWKPSQEGETEIEIISPDDSWKDDIFVLKADDSNRITDLFSNLWIILFIIILLIIIAAVVILRRKKKKEDEYSSVEPVRGPSVFDLTADGQMRSSGSQEPDEPKIIRYSTGLSQVGPPKSGEAKPREPEVGRRKSS